MSPYGKKSDQGSETVTEVYGSTKNISVLGTPSEHRYGTTVRYYFHPTWRSQLILLVTFFVTSVLAVLASRSEWFGWSVIHGKLFDIGDTTWWLDLPLLSLIPAFFLGKVLFNIYNARYIIDDRGVEAQVGLVSLSLRQPRLRFEDIRGVEPKQSLWERILGIGSVLIGSAMTFEVEIIMEGVPNPRAIQILINTERDKRMETLRGDNNRGMAIEFTGD